MTQRRDETFSVHGTHAHEPRDEPVVPPVHLSSTWAFESTARVDDVYEGRHPGHVYSRLGNPTTDAVARKIAHLERGEHGLVTASGMSAISTTVLGLLRASPHRSRRVVAVRDLYGGTHGLLTGLLRDLGVRVDLVDTTDPASLEAALREPADLAYLESPTNPLLRLTPLAACARIARDAGIPSVVDSTFATPVNSRPHELGVDVVVHSATKYLAGHSDVLAGAVTTRRADLMDAILATHKQLGGVLDPDGAYRLDRGLKTLPMRVRAANRNAQAVAEFLEADDRVAAVHYPGLPSHPQHALAREQMPGGCGGVLSFDLAGGLDAAAAFVDALRLIRNSASLGGVESLASIPVTQSHRKLTAQELTTLGLSQGTVRLALGIEHPEDVLADVQAGLTATE